MFGSEIEQVENGCVASCSLDYVELGQQTGYMIADILEGKARTTSHTCISRRLHVDYNSGVLEELGFTMPAARVTSLQTT